MIAGMASCSFEKFKPDRCRVARRVARACEARHGGRSIITDAFPPSIKRREFIPPHADVDDIVTFANEALDITAVQWAR